MLANKYSRVTGRNPLSGGCVEKGEIQIRSKIKIILCRIRLAWYISGQRMLRRHYDNPRYNNLGVHDAPGSPRMSRPGTCGMPKTRKTSEANAFQASRRNTGKLWRIAVRVVCLATQLFLAQCHGRELNDDTIKAPTMTPSPNTIGSDTASSDGISYPRFGREKEKTRIAIVINDGCPSNVTTPEGLMERCMSIWDNSKDTIDKKLQKIHGSGCESFPSFGKESAHLSYKVPLLCICFRHCA